MTCYRPLQAARPTGSDQTPLIYARGTRPRPLAKGWEELELPCGQCIGCRLENSLTWAIRIMHEAQMHDDNCFVTLTYNDQHLPIDGSLNKQHFQKFMKRLRKKYGDGIRFFHCGEYGEHFDRPHYHACLFNIAFTDQIFYKRERDNNYYISEELNEVWGKGFCVIGELTFESAAYVARYVTKKVTGKRADEHYYRDNPLTGAMRQLKPEYATQSRRPGIGSTWFEEYQTDVYPWDEVIVRGHPRKPPRYYDKLLEPKALETLNKVKLQRENAARERATDNTPARLEAKEQVKKAQYKQLTRSYENES